MEVKEYNSSAFHFKLFREDVIDRFSCIYKSITREEIPISFNYIKLLNNIIIDFRLNNIIIMIQSLLNDKAISDNIEIYKTTIKYCNEIMENDIIKATVENINDLYKYSNKEKND
jgi:hypothetical protein